MAARGVHPTHKETFSGGNDTKNSNRRGMIGVHSSGLGIVVASACGGGLCDENEVPVCRGQDFHTEAS